MSKQEATMVRAEMLKDRIRLIVGENNLAGFYMGLNAMIVSPELWRDVLKAIEAVPRNADFATAGKQALEQGAEHFRAIYMSICAETSEAN